jgi:Sec-independent protein translocase protein TatA
VYVISCPAAGAWYDSSMPGFPDLATILVILAIVFGAGSLPKLGEAIGKLIVKRRRAAGTLPPEPAVDAQRAAPDAEPEPKPTVDAKPGS